MTYEDKYLKYKSKYLALKNQLGSGEKSAKDIFVKAYARNPEQVSKILNNDKRFLTFTNITEELDSIFDQIWTVIGKDKNTIDWIIKSYINNTFGVPSSLENLGRFKDSIKKYNVLHANIDGIKPIHEIVGLVELERFIDANEDNFKTIEEKKAKQKNKVELQKKIKEEGEDDKEVLLETDKVIIYHPTTEKGARYYGRNTTWCTAATENNMFNIYNAKGPLYIIQSKSDYKDKYQLHLESKQFMNDKDEFIKTYNVKIHFNDEALNMWFRNIFSNIIIKKKELKIEYLDLITITDLSDLALTNMETLEFYFDFRQLDNSLDKIGNSLDKLTNLQALIYNSNMPLGNSLDKLTNLQTLFLGIKFKQHGLLQDLFNQPLGNSLDKLIKLQTLTLGSKFIQPLGNSLDKLTKLQTLTLGNNFNQPLGNSLDKLTNLQTLTLGFKFDQLLGNSLDKLINLQNLNFGENFNRPLGNSLDKLINLQTLKFIQFNQPLGNSLDKLTNLKTLNDKPYKKNF